MFWREGWKGWGEAGKSYFGRNWGGKLDRRIMTLLTECIINNPSKTLIGNIFTRSCCIIMFTRMNACHFFSIYWVKLKVVTEIKEYFSQNKNVSHVVPNPYDFFSHGTQKQILRSMFTLLFSTHWKWMVIHTIISQQKSNMKVVHYAKIFWSHMIVSCVKQTEI